MQAPTEPLGLQGHVLSAPALLALSFLQDVETIYLLKAKYIWPKEYYHLATRVWGAEQALSPSKALALLSDSQPVGLKDIGFCRQ